jgi:hypothetical protein
VIVVGWRRGNANRKRSTGGFVGAGKTKIGGIFR